MAKNISRPQTAVTKPPGTPDNQIPNQICPHIHFRTDVIDRQILSRKQHLNLLCTPKGYRWVIKKNKDESDADKMDPAKHVFVCSDKRKKTGKTYVHNFLAEIWSLLTPEMVERLKEMLMNEFGMTAEESVKFICEQRIRTLEVAERHHPTSPIEEEEEGEGEEMQDPRIPRVIVGDQKLCDRSEFAVGIDPCQIKEFSRTVSNKLSEYVMAMMCAKRNNRHRRMAEVILNGLCNVTGERCTLDKPKNRLHKILTLVSDRTALWLADNIEDEDKKREKERRKEDAELRKRHIEKMKDREHRKKEHEKLAKEREKQEKKRAKKEDEDAKKAKEEEEKKKADREKKHQELEKNKQNKKGDGSGKDGGDKKPPGKGDGDKPSKGGSKSGASKGGASKGDGSKGGAGKGGESKGGAKGGPGGGAKGQGGGSKGAGGASKGGPSKTATERAAKKQPAGAKKPGSAGAGSQGSKTQPSSAGSRGDEGASSTEDQPENEEKERPEAPENTPGEPSAAPADERNPADEAAGGGTDTSPVGPDKTGEAESTEPVEAKPDETSPEEKPAEAETQPAEAEAKPAEAEAKAAEAEAKAAESEAKAAEAEAKAAEAEAKEAEGQPEAPGESDAAKKEPVQKEPPGKTGEEPQLPEATQKALDSSVSQIVETKPVATPRQEAIKDIISKELEKRVSPQDEETKELIREVSAKTATWIDQKVKGVEDEYGTRDKKVSPVAQRPKGPIFSLRKSEDHINVRPATHLEAEKGIRETRGKVPTIGLDASKPMTPEDAKMWAKWAENATQMAEDWGKWIDKTIQDAEEKTIKYKSKGKEKGKEIDVDKQDWETFTGKTLEEALEWRRNRKALEEMATKWQQKSQKQ